MARRLHRGSSRFAPRPIPHSRRLRRGSSRFSGGGRPCMGGGFGGTAAASPRGGHRSAGAFAVAATGFSGSQLRVGGIPVGAAVAPALGDRCTGATGTGLSRTAGVQLPDEAARTPAQQRGGHEQGQHRQGNLLQAGGRVVGVMQGSSRERRTEGVDGMARQHREAGDPGAERQGDPASVQLREDAEGGDVRRRAGEQESERRPGGYSLVDQDRDQREWPRRRRRTPAFREGRTARPGRNRRAAGRPRRSGWARRPRPARDRPGSRGPWCRRLRGNSPGTPPGARRRRSESRPRPRPERSEKGRSGRAASRSSRATKPAAATLARVISPPRRGREISKASMLSSGVATRKAIPAVAGTPCLTRLR